METTKVTSKQNLSINDVVRYLEKLTKSFKEGTIVVQQDDDYVTFDLPEVVSVEVAGKNKKNKAKLSLELSWRVTDKAATADVTISSEVPKAASVKKPQDAEAQKDPIEKQTVKPSKKPAATKTTTTNKEEKAKAPQPKTALPKKTTPKNSCNKTNLTAVAKKEKN